MDLNTRFKNASIAKFKFDTANKEPSNGWPSHLPPITSRPTPLGSNEQILQTASSQRQRQARACQKASKASRLMQLEQSEDGLHRNFQRPFFGCIVTDLREQILVFQHCAKSTKWSSWMFKIGSAKVRNVHKMSVNLYGVAENSPKPVAVRLMYAT